jgi:large subunit ribosomal protein L29
MKKTERIKEYLRLPDKELRHILSDSKEKIEQLRFDLAAGKGKNVAEIRKIRKDIARLETILKERALNNKEVK